MNNTREFTPEELEDMGLPWGCLWRQQVSSTRWTEVWHGTFDYEGATWLIRWGTGLTEEQAIGPWDEEATITAHRAEPYEHVETRWRPTQRETA